MLKKGGGYWVIGGVLGLWFQLFGFPLFLGLPLGVSVFSCFRLRCMVRGGSVVGLAVFLGLVLGVGRC